jgi:V/A-type H+-transporting ATPase subunit D
LNLLRAARRRERVARGVQVLRRKREALVGELFRIARPAADARTALAGSAARAYPALLDALAVHGRTGLRHLGWPEHPVDVEITARSVWGVPVAAIEQHPPVVRTLGARGTAPGLAGPAAAAAATEFETLLELLLAAAPREMLLRRLGEALAQTARQVNTLERRVGPVLADQVRLVRAALDEREREERTRLKHLLRRRAAGA